MEDLVLIKRVASRLLNANNSYEHEFQLSIRVTPSRGSNPRMGVTFRIFIPEFGTSHVYQVQSSKPLTDISSTCRRVLQVLKETVEGKTSDPHFVLDIPKAGYSSLEYRNIITSANFEVIPVKPKNKMKEALALAKDLAHEVEQACSGSSLKFNYELETV